MMRFNAINVLIMGIAISDIFFLSYYVNGGIEDYLKTGKLRECIPPRSYLFAVFFWLISYLRDVFRRVSTFLGILLALIRALVIRYPTNQTARIFLLYSTSWIVIAVTLLISLPVSWLNWGRVIIKQYEDWEPSQECIGFPKNATYPNYD
uniref:G-protein coupled receptors family 1 profile domain-containing protein n=1 Tax=Caenorhabditis japonica TaxID=281687 RepID=A0A8R1I6D8_CAEJA